MKKMLSLILSALLLLAASPSVYAQLPADTSLWDIVYTKDGERVFSAESGGITSTAHIYNGGEAKNIYIMSCAYNSSGTVSDISVTTQNCAHGYNTLSSRELSTPEGGKVKTLILNRDFSPIKKRSDFLSEIVPMEISSFSLEHNGTTYYGNINNKTNEIFVDVPYYTIGEGESELLRPDLSSASENIQVLGGTLEKVSNETDFEEGVKYLITDENGNSRTYTAYVIYTLRQYSSDFEDSKSSGNVTGNKGTAALTNSGTSGTISVVSDSGSQKLKIEKNSTDTNLSFTADKGCTAEMATDFFMEFDFEIESISEGTDAMYWYMGEMHQIIPSKTANGYTLKYRHGLTGAIKEIPGISEFEFGTMYHLSYSFSQSDMKGQLYINHKIVGTLENIYGKVTSTKLSPIISLTAFKDAKVSALFDNISVTYTEIQPTGKPKLHVIGDSIVQTYLPDSRNIEGWGAFMREYFSEDLFVKNHAMSGQASGMALYSGAPLRSDMAPIWPLLKYNLYEGDYVMIALGWNDTNNSASAYPYFGDPTNDGYANFKKHMNIMISDTLAVGATPILLTPSLVVDPANNKFIQNPLQSVIKDLAAKDSRIVCLDLTSVLLKELGDIGAQTAYEKYYITVAGDKTHNTVDGAKFLADKVRELLLESDCDLKNYLLPANTPSAPKSPLFSVTDSTGKFTYNGYVDKEDKKIYVEQIIDIYANFDGDANGYSKYYNDREGDFLANLQNATYNTTIGGGEQSGNISLAVGNPANITIGNDTYTVILEKHIRGTAANFNAGRYFSLPTHVVNNKSFPDDANKNYISINADQHAAPTHNAKYGGSSLYATALTSITDLQDVWYVPYYNLSYAVDEGQNGRRDTALKIMKKGVASVPYPTLFLSEGTWGYNGKLVISFDFKYTDFNRQGSMLELDMPASNPLIHLSITDMSGESDKAEIRYSSTTTEDTSLNGYGKELYSLPKGEWANIKLIIDKDAPTDKYIVCINDEIVLKTPYANVPTRTIPTSFTGNVMRFGVYGSTNTDFTYYIDNIMLTNSQKRN